MPWGVITDIVAWVAGVVSISAGGVAVLSYGRAMAGQFPVVELFPDLNDYHGSRYTIRIENPSRHTLYLDYIDVKKPKADRIYILPRGCSRRGDIRRTQEDLSRSSTSRLRAIYLRIPPQDSRALEVGFQDDALTPIHFRLHWSTGLPWPDRFFIRCKIAANLKRLKSMRLAADS